MAYHSRERAASLFVYYYFSFRQKIILISYPHILLKNHLGLEGDSSGAVLGAEFSLYVFFSRHLLYLSLLIRKYYFIYFSFSIIFYHFFFVFFSLFLFPVHFSLTCTWYPAGISFPSPFFSYVVVVVVGCCCWG
jgi:hypothetical protein